MKSRYISILSLLFFSNISAMQQKPLALQPIQEPATAAAIARPIDEIEIDTTQQTDLDDPVILPAALPELPPIFIGQHTPRFPIHGDAVAYSRTLHTMKDVIDDPQQRLFPIAQYIDQELHFIAYLLNFLYTEQQARGVIANDRVIAFITAHTNSYRDIPFNHILELINFFDIPDALIAITSVQPLPLPITQEEEIEYNKQLISVFNLAQSTMQRAYHGAIKKEPSKSTTYETAEIHLTVGNENIWQLFGRMLYPNCTKYPEIAKMIDCITTQPTDRKLTQIVHTIKQKITSWPGTYKPSKNTAPKRIEQIVLRAYMHHHLELYEHPLQEPIGRTNALVSFFLLPIKLNNEIATFAFSPDGRTLALGLKNNTIRLWNLTNRSTKLLKGFSTAPITSIDFSYDGKTLVTTNGADGSIRLWSLTNGSSRILKSNTEDIEIPVFSHNNVTMFASILYDNTIQLHGYLSLREALQAPIITYPSCNSDTSPR